MATTAATGTGATATTDPGSTRMGTTGTGTNRSWLRTGLKGLAAVTAGGMVATIGLALVATSASASALHDGGHGDHAQAAGTGAGAGAAQPASDAAVELVRRVFITDRTVGYLALAALCGGWLFLAAVWPDGAAVRRTRRVLSIAWCAGFVATVAGLGLQAATLRRTGLDGAFDGDAIADVLDTDVGRAWAARALLYLLSLPLLGALARDATSVVRSTWWRVGALAVSAGLLRTMGLVGHSTETEDSALGAVADFVHVGALAAWVGGLVLLTAVVLPRRRPDELAAVVPRFSTVAKCAVGTTVVAGIALWWVVVGGVDATFDTHYGRVLLLKLGVLGAVLAAAWSSKRWVDRRLRDATTAASPDDGDDGPSDPVATSAVAAASIRPFVVSVAMEVVLAVVLLGVASVLVSTNPGT